VPSEDVPEEHREIFDILIVPESLASVRWSSRSEARVAQKARKQDKHASPVSDDRYGVGAVGTKIIDDDEKQECQLESLKTSSS
jgi:hypothetical protein